MGTITLGYTDNRSDRTVYGIIIDAAGNYYTPASDTFTAFSAMADHAVAMTHTANGYYEATVTSTFANGKYLVRVYAQTGGSPDVVNDKMLTVSVAFYSSIEKKEVDTELLHEKYTAMQERINQLQDDASATPVTMKQVMDKLDEMHNLLKAILSRR